MARGRMENLAKKRCIPCEKGTKPLADDVVSVYLKEAGGWSVSEDAKKISREFKFADFVSAMAFVNEVAELAEYEGHHPDITIWYNRVKFELWTHAIGGLSENDFIMAAKINQAHTEYTDRSEK